MSEYQYFEFRTLDAPLDEQAQRDLRRISSRAAITATSFTNSYQWGDLKADPAQMLARWFDAFLHVTNWGTRWLAFRVPRGAIARDLLAPYEGELFSSREAGEHVCLHFLLEDEEPSDWIDGEEWLGSLLPLRDALCGRDARSLYLAWLRDVGRAFVEEDELEPPVPPGLAQLDGPHKDFAEFLEVDADLLAVAVEASAPLRASESSDASVARWLATIDAAEKDRWLARVVRGEGAQLRWELQARLRESAAPATGREQGLRTAGEILDRAVAMADERRKRKERERAERRRKDVERRAAARRQHLDRLEGREPELWQRIDELISTVKPKAYDQAVVLLTDLRDLADRSEDRASWSARLEGLRATHAKKSSLLRRIDKLGVEQGRGA